MRALLMKSTDRQDWSFNVMMYPRENIPLHIKLKNGIKTKGFFYWNGKTPTFASFGTPIDAKDVLEWAYLIKTNNSEAAAKPPRKERTSQR